MRAEILEKANTSVEGMQEEITRLKKSGRFIVDAGETLTFPDTDIKYFELQVRIGAQVILSSFFLEEEGEVPEKGANYIESNFNKDRFERRFLESILNAGSLMPIRDEQ